MEGLLNIFQSITNSNHSNVEIFLKALGDHQSFCYNESNTSIIQNITSLLSQSSTRHVGLLVLSEFLKQAPYSVLEEKGALWATLCIKACDPKEQPSCSLLAYNILYQLVQKSVDIPELMKAFTSHLLQNIFENINNINENCYLSALKLIKICFELYSGSCSQFRTTTEKFLYSLVDNRDENVVRLTGKCLHLLQQIRGTAMHGVSLKNSWQTYQLKLLGSLHELLNKMYSNCSEVYDDNVEEEKIKFYYLKLSNEPIKRSLQLYTRFKNILSYFDIAIREPFPVSKCIMPKKIFNLISRVLAINCKILEKNSISDNLAIGALLPDIHVRCFKVIRTLILILKSNLATYYTTILNFVTDTLKWTSFGKTVGFCKPYNCLRIAAYQTLSLWCETMNHGSECQLFEEQLIEQILYDITPFQSEITIKVLTGTKKHMSKKARRLLHKAQNEQTHLVQAHSKSTSLQNSKKEYSDEGNQHLCAVALNCLKYVLISSSHCLKPTLMKKIQLQVIQLCIQITNEKYENKKLLYSNIECRKNLYAVLYSFVTSSNHLSPAPIQILIPIINRANIYDNSKLIRENCNSYMRNFEKILHPHKDNLNFPHDFDEIKKALKNYYNEDLIEYSEEDLIENSNENKDENNTQNVSSVTEQSESGQREVDIIDVSEIQKSNGIVDKNNSAEKENENEIEINSEESNEGSLVETVNLSEDNDMNTVESIGPVSGKSSEIVNISDESMNPDECEPSAKKIRLNNEESIEDVILCETNESVSNKSKEQENNSNEKNLESNEDELVDEIAGTFINELNEESGNV